VRLIRRIDEKVIERAGWTWRVRPELVDKVDAIAARVLSGDRAGATAVKQTGGRRAIWKMELGEAGVGEAFVKHYSRPTFIKQLKHVFRNSRTRQEWKMGVRLDGMGLPVARHLAMAERRVGRLLMEDYLIEESLSGYENFDDWFKDEWEDVTSGPEVVKRRKAVEGLADLIRFMHDKGVLQRDFKPDSVMVGPDGELKLVDLERALVKIGGLGLSRGARVANLAKTDQTFGFIGTMTDRIRFLKRYFKDEKLSPKKLRRLMIDISRGAEVEWRKRAREVRIWANTENESYEQYRVGHYRVSTHFCIHRAFIEALIREINGAAVKKHVCDWGPGHTPRPVAARWTDARSALEATTSLYYRKPPFTPARSAIYPGTGRFGLLLSVDPDPALDDWVRGAEGALAGGRIVTFATDLGRTLRVIHRMGITHRIYHNDSMLHDPGAPGSLSRFYINRMDDLVLDRSPSAREAMRRLDIISDLLGLPPEASSAMKGAYRECKVRWFGYHPGRWD